MLKQVFGRISGRAVPAFGIASESMFKRPLIAINNPVSNWRQFCTSTAETPVVAEKEEQKNVSEPKVFRFNENPEVPVQSFKTGNVLSSIVLNRDMFNLPLRQDILHQIVVWQLASKRAGTACTKERSEVAGSRRKLYAQKHTGKARVGDKKAGHRRGGGTTHGPKPRDYSYPLNKKVRRLGLRTVLSTKLAQGKLFVVGDLPELYQETRAKEIVKVLKTRNWDSVLVIDDESNESFKKATGGLVELSYLPAQEANVYDIMKKDTLILTPQAINKLSETLRVPGTA
eukprot:c7145_g1_i1.p1 GENE.c7145_g1_i1~~c7145_g1_i1.p1  ORF type:complete len:286 (+),score=110.89 c7145_g1_i1:58-915(+)